MEIVDFKSKDFENKKEDSIEILDKKDNKEEFNKKNSFLEQDSENIRILDILFIILLLFIVVIIQFVLFIRLSDLDPQRNFSRTFWYFHLRINL
ncbi:MAG: hypothetical protein GY870_07020 [archaeon]|nr:hypothetical protein [archaeon]